ncbi:DNA-binding response regulator [Pseudoalteromonas sp. A25]|uniref:LytR/AlgR family response regulator transcription factor n=1 Tax=Pseudoalteromonas sp. A25 TaxID=116092 RepID=UPI00126101F4|nr:LytTR family DNA-binding domain-containing protein [Pseudoalteromonas sp. A25]BBN83054.1 DNA-binding response regulator [Pseudoalteromonas sp. A25]
MIKTVVVDDERLARADLKRLLANFDDIQIIAEYENAQGLIDNFDELEPDLVFLDIHMPNISGIQAAVQLRGKTQFIFCTAYAQYAVDAFDLKAVDYLVKPVRVERLKQAIERCDFTERGDPPLPDNYQLLLKFSEVQRMTRLDQVERFEVVGNDVALYTTYGKTYLRSPISRIEQRLDNNKYFKANRSEIIRLDKVVRFEASSSSTMIATMQSTVQVSISRRQVKELKRLHGDKLFGAF